MERINVLHIISPSGLAGAEKTTAYTMAEINDRHPDITNELLVVCRTRDETDLSDLFSFLQGVSIPNVRYEVFSRFSLATTRFLFAHIMKNNFHLIHSHGYKGSILAACCKCRFGLPVVATMHGWTGVTWQVRIYEFLEKLCYFFFQRIFIMSRAQLNELKVCGRLPKHIQVVPSGLPQNEFRPISEVRNELGSKDVGGVLRFGFAGRLSGEKGFRIFVDQMRQLLANNSHVRVSIAGAGPEEHLAVALDRESDQVSYLGFEAEVDRFYSQTDVVVIPSLREGMPRVLLESMARGKLVVASDAGGVSELVIPNQTGLIYNKNKPAELGAILNEIVSSGLYAYADMCIQGRIRVEEEYSIKVRGRTVAQAYRELANKYQTIAENCS
jgi:glycosyltransferase involved in cell wall biosynthesis